MVILQKPTEYQFILDTSSTTTAEYSIVSVEIPEKVESTKLVSGVQDVKPGINEFIFYLSTTFCF